jgi:hypothetical protein
MNINQQNMGQMNMNMNQMGQQNQQWNYNNMQQQPQQTGQGNQQFYNQGMAGNMGGGAPQSKSLIIHSKQKLFFHPLLFMYPPTKLNLCFNFQPDHISCIT